MFARGSFASGSFRQHNIAEHAFISELNTASVGAAQTMPFSGILSELGIKQSAPVPIFSDSRSTILAARSHSSLKKSLYVLRRILFMREGHDNGEWNFYSCKGKINPADPLTKHLEATPFFKARDYYMGKLNLNIPDKK